MGGYRRNAWVVIAEIRTYHPDKPARATVYEWVNLKKVPVHKDGKRLRFLKSEIDEWLCKGRRMTQEEIDQEAYSYLRRGKR